ncbi:hypothetical protein HYV58_01785, partial [Candidatus Peregrinibacteria bacterium]|nr:hypothetical protein [Candidatus Peregrinibacteria bacterium]
MGDPRKIIEDGIRVIKKLIASGYYPDALRWCQDMLAINPYHRDVLGYFNKVQKLILRENERKVDADIDNTMHFWKEHRYNDLRTIYLKLLPYAPQHRRLRKLIKKLNEQLTDAEKKNRSEFIRKAEELFRKLLFEERYGELIQAASELLQYDPINREAPKYIQKAKDLLIEKKLAENQHLVEGSNFARALDFYESLLKIDAENRMVKRLAHQVRLHLAEQKFIAEKIHLNESIARMKELFKNAEYEKVFQACEEIDHFNPNNFTSKVFKAKALRTIHDEIEHLSVKKL